MTHLHQWAIKTLVPEEVLKKNLTIPEQVAL